MSRLLQRHWFLLLLGLVLVCGMGFPGSCAPLASYVPKNAVVATVLVLMALPLEASAMWNTLRRPGPAVLAIAVNAVAIPLLAWPASFLFEDSLAVGLIVAAAVPCTIASATVWTRLAGGNEAVSIMVTVVTNLACFLVTPGWILLLLGRQSSTQSFSELAFKLLMIVVVPILAAQLLRRHPLVAAFAASRGKLLSYLAQLGILSIVFVGAVYSGQKLAGLSSQFAEVIGQCGAMMLIVSAIHVVAWFIGLSASAFFGFSRPDQLAVAFAGSQKTLMVGLAIALEFGGLAILPMLAYHVEQLLIDTILAGRYRSVSPAIGPAHD